MALTQLTDVIVPEIFLPYVMELTKERSAFFQAGIVAEDAVISEKMQGGGAEINLPFWHDLDSADATGIETLTTDNPASAISTYKVDADEQVAIIKRRAVAFSAADLAGTVAGSDPMQVVAQRIAPYWNRRFQQCLLSVCNGVILKNIATYNSDMIKDVSTDGVVAAANRFSPDAFIDAAGTLGDAADDIRVVAMHSKLYQIMQKQNLIDFIPSSDGKVQIPTYLGKRVVVSDAMPTGTSGANTTTTAYLFAPGAIGYGESMAKVPVAVDRDELAADGGGVEFFISRRDFCFHPYGWAFVKTGGGALAGKTPSNTELALAAKWLRVFERKNIAFAALKVNTN